MKDPKNEFKTEPFVQASCGRPMGMMWARVSKMSNSHPRTSSEEIETIYRALVEAGRKSATTRPSPQVWGA